MEISRSVVKIFTGKVGATVVNFGAIVYFAWFLGADGIGVFFLFQALVQVLAIPSDFGLRRASEKRISEGERPGDVFATAVLIKLVPLSLIAALVLLAEPLINSFVGLPVSWLLIVAISALGYGRLMISVVSGELRVGETASLRFSRRFVWAILGAVLVQFGFGPRGLIYSLITGHLVAILWGLYKCSTPFGRPKADVAGSLVDYSKYDFVTGIGVYAYNWIDILIIGLFLDQTAVGMYEIAWRVTSVMIILSSSVGIVVFPQISEWNANELPGKIERLVTQSLSWVLLVVIPACFGIVLYARDILTLLFGAEYGPAWIVLSVLAGEKVFRSIYDILRRTLKGIDRPELSAKATTIAVLINVVLNFVLIWYFGILGAAVATTVSFSINTVLHWVYLSRYVSITLSGAELGWSVVSASLMSGTLFVVNRWVPVNSIPKLVAFVGAGVLIYGACILLVESIRTRVVSKLRELTLH